MKDFENSTENHSSKKIIFSNESMRNTNTPISIVNDLNDHQSTSEQLTDFKKQLNKPQSISEFLGFGTTSKQLVKLKAKFLEAEANSNLEELKVISDFRIEGLKFKSKAGLDILNTYFGFKRSKFVMDMLTEMQNEVSIHQMKAVESVTEKIKYSEGISNQFVKEIYIESIKREGLRYFNFLESVLYNYSSILDEKISI